MFNLLSDVLGLKQAGNNVSPPSKVPSPLELKVSNTVPVPEATPNPASKQSKTPIVVSYLVQDTDTINSISRKFKMSKLELSLINRIYAQNNVLFPGQYLYVYTNQQTVNSLLAASTSTLSASTSISTSPSSPNSPLSFSSSFPNPSFLSNNNNSKLNPNMSLPIIADSELINVLSNYPLLLPALRTKLDDDLPKYSYFTKHPTEVTRPGSPPSSSSKSDLDFFGKKALLVKGAQRISGVLIGTPLRIAFEPDIDDPIVQASSYNEYSLDLPINTISDSHVVSLSQIKDTNTQQTEGEKATNGLKCLQISRNFDVFHFVFDTNEGINFVQMKIDSWIKKPSVITKSQPNLPQFLLGKSPINSLTNTSNNTNNSSNNNIVPLSPTNSFNSAISSYTRESNILKEEVLFTSKYGHVKGILTILPYRIIFEPDLSDPLVTQYGLVSNQVDFTVSNIEDCFLVGSFQPPYCSHYIPEATFKEKLETSSSHHIGLAALQVVDNNKTVVFEGDEDLLKKICIKIKLFMRDSEGDVVPQSMSRKLSFKKSEESSSSNTPFRSTSPLNTSGEIGLSPLNSLTQSLLSTSQSIISSSASIFTSLFNPTSNNDTKQNPDTKTSNEGKTNQDEEKSSGGHFEFEGEDIKTSSKHSIFVPSLQGSSQIPLTPYMLSQIAEHFPFKHRFSNWINLYSTSRHGISINTMYAKLRNKGPVVILIEDANHYVFGGFASESLHTTQRYYGTGESFLFQLSPNINFYHWTRANDFFILSMDDFISMGGGGTGRYGFWLDADFLKGSSGACDTFGSPCLASSDDFECLHLEIWGFPL
eukprot:TRINITY_DN4981_c0_g1_i1.p1 TRINITY_DN4981_c0_g1~~TRINITY_DN4981_c0_g1_i1.p1  ORF type:complete len:818 (+),score=190.30 TRINITY_DN4981_c0_g1_i1:195-2648(+)